MAEIFLSNAVESEVKGKIFDIVVRARFTQ